MPRPQFTLRALLVAMLVVGAFFGGMAVQRKLDTPLRQRTIGVHRWGRTTWSEKLVLPDGSRWHRYVVEDDDPRDVEELRKRLDRELFLDEPSRSATPE